MRTITGRNSYEVNAVEAAIRDTLGEIPELDGPDFEPEEDDFEGGFEWLGDSVGLE